MWYLSSLFAKKIEGWCWNSALLYITFVEKDSDLSELRLTLKALEIKGSINEGVYMGYNVLRNGSVGFKGWTSRNSDFCFIFPRVFYFFDYLENQHLWTQPEILKLTLSNKKRFF